MPPRSTHPRHQQHKPLRRGGGGADAASRFRTRRRVKVVEPPRPPPLPSSSVSSSTPAVIVGELPPLPSLFLSRASTKCSMKCCCDFVLLLCSMKCCCANYREGEKLLLIDAIYLVCAHGLNYDPIACSCCLSSTA
jgi:hypothetical protein